MKKVISIFGVLLAFSIYSCNHKKEVVKEKNLIYGTIHSAWDTKYLVDSGTDIILLPVDTGDFKCTYLRCKFDLNPRGLGDKIMQHELRPQSRIPVCLTKASDGTFIVVQ